jgi:hypothetical protein
LNAVTLERGGHLVEVDSGVQTDEKQKPYKLGELDVAVVSSPARVPLRIRSRSACFGRRGK